MSTAQRVFVHASTGHQVLLFLHLLCAIGGFGIVIYQGFSLGVARRRGDSTVAGVLAVQAQLAPVADALLTGVLLFGIGAVLTSQGASSFSDPWVSAALGTWVVMLGVLHGLVRPSEKRYRQAMLELARTPPMAPPNRPAQLDELEGLYRRLSAGQGIFNLLLVGALYLMTFKP